MAHVPQVRTWAPVCQLQGAWEPRFCSSTATVESLSLPSSPAQIGHKRIRTVRTRGGNTKYRALRVDTGNFSWATECKRRPSLRIS